MKIPNLDDFSHFPDFRVIDQSVVMRVLNCDADELTQLIGAEFFPYPRHIAGQREWVVCEIRRALRRAALQKEMTDE